MIPDALLLVQELVGSVAVPRGPDCRQLPCSRAMPCRPIPSAYLAGLSSACGSRHAAVDRQRAQEGREHDAHLGGVPLAVAEDVAAVHPT